MTSFHSCSITGAPLQHPFTTSCSHVFETKVLAKWLQKHHVCPYDLNHLSSEDVQRVAQSSQHALADSSSSSDDAVIFKWYQRAARGQKPIAQYELAKCYQKGIGTRPNPAEAVYWFYRAARGDLAKGQYRLATALLEGQGVRQDKLQALNWMRRAAILGHAKAQYRMGGIYAGDLSEFEKNYSTALYWFQKAADQGDVEAQNCLGVLYLSGLAGEKNPELGVRWLSRSAAAGSSFALYRLGLCYLYAEGVEADSRIGTSLLEAAASQGYEKAATFLQQPICSVTGRLVQHPSRTSCGHLFETSALRKWLEKEGVCPYDHHQLSPSQVQRISAVSTPCFSSIYPTTDDTFLFEWYHRAAEKGIPIAQYELGKRYQQGIGTKINAVAAARLFYQAAEQNEPQAQYQLAEAFLKGEGTEADLEAALHWMEEAAKLGYAEAQRRMGEFYTDGAQQDDAAAIGWFKLAADQGDIKALYWLGTCYAYGFGVERNSQLACEYFCRSVPAQQMPDFDLSVHRLAPHVFIEGLAAQLAATGIHLGAAKQSRENAAWLLEAIEREKKKVESMKAQAAPSSGGILSEIGQELSALVDPVLRKIEEALGVVGKHVRPYTDPVLQAGSEVLGVVSKHVRPYTDPALGKMFSSMFYAAEHASFSTRATERAGKSLMDAAIVLDDYYVPLLPSLLGGIGVCLEAAPVIEVKPVSHFRDKYLAQFPTDPYKASWHALKDYDNLFKPEFQSIATWLLPTAAPLALGMGPVATYSVGELSQIWRTMRGILIYASIHGHDLQDPEVKGKMLACLLTVEGTRLPYLLARAVGSQLGYQALISKIADSCHARLPEQFFINSVVGYGVVPFAGAILNPSQRLFKQLVKVVGSRYPHPYLSVLANGSTNTFDHVSLAFLE